MGVREGGRVRWRRRRGRNDFFSVYHLGFRIINASAIPFKYGGGLSSLSLRIYLMWEKPFRGTDGW